MAKKRASLTTPNHKMTLRNQLAELMMFRAYHGKLPPYFWRESRWKWEYGKEVQAISKFIKKYGEDVVSHVIKRNYLTSARTYANVEFLLQREFDRILRISKFKDKTDVEPLVPKDNKDLRDEGAKLVLKKKNLFERLSEIERDSL